MTKKCGQCTHFIGFGDWSLCCDLMHDLTYENNDACPKFEQATVCRNRSRIVGGFFCSICGHTGWDFVLRPDNRCPKCGNEVME